MNSTQSERAALLGRYHVTVIKPHPTGPYVGYEDRTEEVEALRAERDRYREALEEIVERTKDRGYTSVWRIAREALDA